MPTFVDRGESRGQRGGSPAAVIFLDLHHHYIGPSLHLVHHEAEDFLCLNGASYAYKWEWEDIRDGSATVRQIDLEEGGSGLSDELQ
jgi:hypothetical protein